MDLGLRGGSDFWRCAKDQKPLELRYGMSYVYEVCGEEGCRLGDVLSVYV